MTPDLLSFESAVSQLIAKQQLDPALAAIRALVDTLCTDPAATGSVLRSASIDRLCQEVGSTCLSFLRSENIVQPLTEQPADIIVLATELRDVGGHSRVVADILQVQHDKRVLILMTDFYDRNDAGKNVFAIERFTKLGAEVRLAPSGSYTDKLMWTQRQLASHPAAQVLVFNHHSDAAAIAAIQPNLNREVVFCHHGDHNLCLGASLKWVKHIDFFDAYCLGCRDAGLDAELWPLSTPDLSARPSEASSFRSTGPLTSCTSCNDVKLTPPYPFHYWDVLPLVMDASGGTHIHIGQLANDVFQGILTGLAAHGISSERFKNIPWVESVGDTLKQLKVDLYIGSFPLGGGRATIEAMAAGIPIVTHKNSLSPILGCAGFGPTDTWCWSAVPELIDIIRQATPAALSTRSRQVREHYLNNHSQTKFTAAIRGETRQLPDPKAGQHVDELTSYLLRTHVRHEKFSLVFDYLDKEIEAPYPIKTHDIDTLETAIVHFEAGRLAEAHEALINILSITENNPPALMYLGLIAMASELAEDAQNFFDHAIAFSQDRANTQAAIGQRCLEAQQFEFAEHYFNAAIQSNPQLLGAHALLADTLEQQGRKAEALQKLSTQNAPILLARRIKLARELADSEAEYQACLEAAAHPDCYARAIELMGCIDGVSLEEQHEHMREFVSRHMSSEPLNQPQHRHSRPSTSSGQAGLHPSGNPLLRDQPTLCSDVDSRFRGNDGALGMTSQNLPTRLKLGFVIGKLDQRDTAHRLEPLLQHLDPSRFETILLAREASTGQVVQRLFLLADQWIPTGGLNAVQMDQLIREQGVDILINLDGFASHAALEPFSQRSAPLQLDWVTASLAGIVPCIDTSIQIQDIAWSLPTYMPCLPKRADQPFTFACMTPANQISIQTWDTWRRILIARPNTHLQLNAATLDESAQQYLLTRFTDHGIAPHRITWVNAFDERSACDAWQAADIGLCPLTGDCTYQTLLGAWIGVASIATVNALSQLQLDEFIARDIEHYIALACRAATDADWVQSNTLDLHKRVAASAAHDAKGFAQTFGETLMTLWQKQSDKVGVES